MYEYSARIRRVVDGDTVDVDIDLGFGVILSNQRIRLYGIDTPESRTRDPIEKVFGKMAGSFLKDKLGERCKHKHEYETYSHQIGEHLLPWERQNLYFSNTLETLIFRCPFCLSEFYTHNRNMILRTQCLRL